MKKIISLLLTLIMAALLLIFTASCSANGGDGRLGENKWKRAFDFSDVDNVTISFSAKDSGAPDSEVKTAFSLKITPNSIYRLIEEEGYMEDVLRMEKDYDKDLLLREVFQPLLSVEEEENRLLEMFQEKAPDDGNTIVLITGVGKSFPIVRSHTILNNLQSIFRRNPVVMMYPGRYEIKNSMTLRLFERLDDDNYYRAFPLVERRVDK